MHVLIIGGTRFVGALLTWRLLAGGHRITLLNRGSHGQPFGQRVEQLTADRTGPDFERALAGRRFDAAVDFAAFTAADAREVVRVLGQGRVGHYIMVSTGQVYLVREPRPAIAREQDYAGPVMAEPCDERDQPDWRYGIDKRGCEDVLAAAWDQAGFPATRLRIPMVNGERDYYRRLESYLWRLLDGGPIIVPGGGGAPTRHVYAGEVARAIAEMLANKATFGHGYNLAQIETPTLVELLELVADLLGIRGAPAARTLELVPMAMDQLLGAGLEPVRISPFSGRWMSFLDPGRIGAELGFRHEPLASYLGKITASFLAHTPPAPPPGYAHRARELELCARAG